MHSTIGNIPNSRHLNSLEPCIQTARITCRPYWVQCEFKSKLGTMNDSSTQYHWTTIALPRLMKSKKPWSHDNDFLFEPYKSTFKYPAYPNELPQNSRREYRPMHTASLGRRDGLISAQVTISSPSLQARALFGEECWNQPISPYPTIQYAFTRTKIYLKRQNQTVQWSS